MIVHEPRVNLVMGDGTLTTYEAVSVAGAYKAVEAYRRSCRLTARLDGGNQNLTTLTCRVLLFV